MRKEYLIALEKLNVSKEDFEKFIWAKSMDFEKRLEETQDIIKRLKDR